jgi:hypothetical protein
VRRSLRRRPDPISPEERSLTVDYGINHALSMHDRIVDVEHGDRRGSQVSTASSGTAADRIREVVGACARLRDDAADVAAAPLDGSALWTGIGKQAAVCSVHANAQPSRHDNCHLPVSFKHKGQKCDPHAPPQGPVRLSIGVSPLILDALSEK